VRDQIKDFVIGVTDLRESFTVHNLVKDTRRSEMRREVVGIILAIAVPFDEGAIVAC